MNTNVATRLADPAKEIDLSKLVLFQLDVTLICGRKQARTDDIESVKGVRLEQDDVLTLGSKKIFDPEAVRALKRYRDRMLRCLLKDGSPFMGGIAVPADRAEGKAMELDNIVDEAHNYRDGLIAKLPSLIEDYANKNQAWSDTIKQSAYTPDYIRRKVRFAWHHTRVAAVGDSDRLSRNLRGNVGGLLGQVLDDVAKEARLLQEKSLQGKDQTTRKVLRPLLAAKEKLLGFEFLDPRVRSVAAMIEAVAKSIPARGPIEGQHLAMLWGITTVLCDPERTLEVATGFESQGASHLLQQLVASRAASRQAASQLSAAQRTAETKSVNVDLPLELFSAPVEPPPATLPVRTARHQTVPATPRRGLAAFASLSR